MAKRGKVSKFIADKLLKQEGGPSQIAWRNHKTLGVNRHSLERLLTGENANINASQQESALDGLGYKLEIVKK
jgi:hypothetical protein